MNKLNITAALLLVLTLVPQTARAAPKEFPEIDVSIRWSTVGAFQPEFGLFNERHYVDRINPEVGVHVLEFLTITGEYAHANMSGRTTFADEGSNMSARFRQHAVGAGVRVHPPWRGFVLPFFHVNFAISTATVTMDTPDGGFYGFWSESNTRPELALTGGTEILFPRGIRERSHEALSGKTNRMIRNATVGAVIEVGHVIAPRYEFDRFGDLSVSAFTFELGFIAHL